MSPKNPLENKEIRFRILRTLHISHPYGVKESLILLTVNDAGHRVTEQEIASEVVYLREKGYIESDRKPSRTLRTEIWFHTITPKGIDLLEGNLPPDPGINEAENG